MIEILGTIASIRQLVNTALKARKYLKDFRNAPAEQQKLFTEMEDLNPLLAELQNRVSASPSTSTLQHITAPLTRFNTTLERFNAKFRPADGGDGQWSNKEYANEFESIKSLITVWLAVDISCNVGHQQNDILTTVAQHVQAQQLRFSARTGEWLLADPRFKSWELESGKILWCRGMPGAGKTVLSSIVVNHLEADLRTDSIGIACIYLNHKETDTHTVLNLVASLCKQLLVDKPIPSTLMEMYLRHSPRGTRPCLDETLNALRFVMAEYAKIYLVVDALDEYPEDERNALLEYLSTITLGPPIINLLMTSRPNITLTPFFSDVNVLEIRATNDDIRQYVETHIRKSSRLSRHVQTRPELCAEISSKIIANVQGMFLLAKLHMDSLTTKHTVSAVRETLQQLPKDLNHAFDSTIERISQQNTDDKEVARLALIWVAYSKRPLTVPEFLEALAIEPDTTTLDVDNVLDIDIVLSVCGGLVIVNEELSAVRLVHYTAQHYLDGIRTDQFPDAHAIIASRCFTYLSFKEFPTINHPTIRVDKPEGQSCETSIPSIQPYCFQHAADASGLYPHWRASPWNYPHWPSSPSLLWISAASNLVAIAEHLLMKECIGGHFGTALQASADHGSNSMVQLLIELGANAAVFSAHTPVQTSSKSGPKGCVRDEGTRIGITDGIVQRTRLLVKLLIDNGADVNSRGGHYGTALQAASAMGHEGRFGTALHAASDLGHETVVRLLIEKGAEVNLRVRDHGTALQKASARKRRFGSALEAASYSGHESIVHVDPQGEHFVLALNAASKKGHREVVHFLMDASARLSSLLTR
ncbi:hypothetical protein B0H12DRAFT_1122246 [Mycena haematopus]|nr:hypothetical protein B0H12DRAFT_1122246 [Mycena haematopus]